MSQQLINRSPDLKKLRDEGYNVAIRAGHLLLAEVPYVNANRELRRGTLVSTLNLAGDIATTPETHVATFIGEYPCDQYGVELEAIRHTTGSQLAEGLTVDFSFSSKPSGGYQDYYEKMTSYVTTLESYAQALDPEITARTFSVIATTDDDDSPFQYIDTASSRASIGALSAKLELARVAILGLGGTGSYILDFVAKTPVREIHLFDGDVFLSHNAFRAPGAASLDELRQLPRKVNYLREKYSNMHRNIVAHEYHMDTTNLDELQGMDFVFLCIDASGAKAQIVEKLEALGIPFIDVGMGIDEADGGIGGILQITSSTPGQRDHFRKHVSLADTEAGDEYASNIQIADLNALNATLAVIKWKKLFGFYRDYERAGHVSYTIDGDMLLSEDQNA